MPYVNIKITDEGVTKEQKHQLIRGATQLLVDVLGKNPTTTVVVIDDDISNGVRTERELRATGLEADHFGFGLLRTLVTRLQ